MPNPFHFRSALNQLARLAAESYPAHIRFRAASALVSELSPANPQHELVQRMLQATNPYEFARHQLRDLYDNAHPTIPDQTTDSLLSEEEQPSEQDDDPL